MAFTIGKDNTTDAGGGSRTNASAHVLLAGASFSYVAQHGDYVNELGFHAGSNTGNGQGVELGLYDITSGVSGAPLIRAVTIPTITGSARNAAAVANTALTAGNTYAVGLRVVSSENVSIFGGYFGSNASRAGSLTGILPLTSWADAGADEGQFSIFATGDTGSLSGIVSINDGTVKGGESIALETVDFVAVSLRIGDLDVSEFTLVDDENYTAVMPPMAEGYYPPFGSVTATAVNAADDEATISVTNVIQDGYSETEIESINSDDESSIYSQLVAQHEFELEVGGKLYGEYTIFNDTTYEDWPDGTNSIFYRPPASNDLVEILIQFGEVSLPLQPLRFATQWNAIHSSSESRTALGYVSRWEHYIGSGPVSDIVLSFDAWYLGSSSNGPCTNLGNDIPIVDCSLEYNGVTTPVTFSGNRNITITNGAADIQSDNINIMEAFGVESLPVNARIDVKLKVLLTSTAHVMPASFRKTGAGIGQVWFYNPASTTISSTDDPGAYVNTGAVQGRSTGYSPTILGRHTTAVKTLFIRGDSISAGTGDTGYNQSGLGWIQRAIGMLDTPLAAYNGAVPSMKIEGGRTDARFTDLYQYATDGIVAGATNNFGTTGTSATVSGTLTSIGNAISEMKTGGMEKVGVMRLIPRATSTDSWATEANQTVSAGWNTGDRPDQYNQALVAGTYDFLFLNDSVRGVNPAKWRVNGAANGFAADSVHPSQGGHIAMATEAVPVIMQSILGISPATDSNTMTARRMTASGMTARRMTGSGL